MNGEPPRTDAEPEREAQETHAAENVVDTALRAFVQDSSLWPALVVTVLILATLACAVLVLAFIDHNPAAMAAVGGLLFLSYQACQPDRRARKPGPRTWILLTIWALATAALLTLEIGAVFKN